MDFGYLFNHAGRSPAPSSPHPVDVLYRARRARSADPGTAALDATAAPRASARLEAHDRFGARSSHSARRPRAPPSLRGRSRRQSRVTTPLRGSVGFASAPTGGPNALAPGVRSSAISASRPPATTARAPQGTCSASRRRGSEGPSRSRPRILATRSAPPRPRRARHRGRGGAAPREGADREDPPCAAPAKTREVRGVLERELAQALALRRAQAARRLGLDVVQVLGVHRRGVPEQVLQDGLRDARVLAHQVDRAVRHPEHRVVDGSTQSVSRPSRARRVKAASEGRRYVRRRAYPVERAMASTPSRVARARPRKTARKPEAALGSSAGQSGRVDEGVVVAFF